MKKAHILLLGVLIIISCSFADQENQMTEEDRYKSERLEMVSKQIEGRGIKNENVLAAMRKVKRHLFVPEERRGFAYGDYPIPIGHQQTISQPYIVAVMTDLIEPEEDFTVLEIGTGSGYQAAILAEIVKEVYSIEIVEPLSKNSKALLKDLGYKNVHLKCGDGFYGWPDKAPFDAIIVTAAPPTTPKPLIDQLKIGGRLVIPVGKTWQELVVITRTKTGSNRDRVFSVRFVPMTGEAQKVN